MERLYGIGIIGTGSIFNEHAEALASLPDRARLIAAADLDEDSLRRAAARHFVPVVYSEPRELMARDDVDMVVVATPPSTHASLAIDALEAGKHVVCEKPLAHTLDEADRIIEAARRFPGRLSVVYQMRYMPEIQKMIWLRDEGLLGDLRCGQVTRTATAAVPNGRRNGWWGQWQVAGGGVAMTQFIHQLDWIVHIFGRPTQVSAVMDTLKEPIESEDTFSAHVRFDNGAIVACSATLAAQRWQLSVDVMGSLASVHLPWTLKAEDTQHERAAQERMHDVFGAPPTPQKQGLAGRAVRKARRKLRISRPASDTQTRPRKNLHAHYHADLLDAIGRGEPPPITPEAARVSLELCVAIYSSAIAQAPVSLPLDTSDPCYRGITPDAYRNRVTLAAG